jgi:hypothetical protein
LRSVEDKGDLKWKGLEKTDCLREEYQTYFVEENMEIQKKIVRSAVIPDTGSRDLNYDSIKEIEERLRHTYY